LLYPPSQCTLTWRQTSPLSSRALLVRSLISDFDSVDVALHFSVEPKHLHGILLHCSFLDADIARFANIYRFLLGLFALLRLAGMVVTVRTESDSPFHHLLIERSHRV
jgi:hypothetical protein